MIVKDSNFHKHKQFCHCPKKKKNHQKRLKILCLIILITGSTVEVNRFPVLIDPSRQPLHRIRAWRQLTHLIQPDFHGCHQSWFSPGTSQFYVFNLTNSSKLTRYLTNSWNVGTVPFLRSVLYSSTSPYIVINSIFFVVMITQYLPVKLSYLAII